MLVVVVVINRHVHNFKTHNAKYFPLRVLGVHVPSQFFRALVLNLEISLGHLIGDEEKTVLDVLAVFYSAYPSILCQQYCGLIVLVQDIILSCIPLSLHKIFTPHHHPKNI